MISALSLLLILEMIFTSLIIIFLYCNPFLLIPALSSSTLPLRASSIRMHPRNPELIQFEDQSVSVPELESSPGYLCGGLEVLESDKLEDGGGAAAAGGGGAAASQRSNIVVLHVTVAIDVTIAVEVIFSIEKRIRKILM